MTQRVVIIGAPRSGTNMLRDLLTRADGVATWPCDEVNLLWRHHNRQHPSDELHEDQARPEVVAYVQRQFEKIGRRYDAATVVEKTCANSLRVPFVDRCVPDARYVLITRDGIDAAASAVDRWDAPFDARYTARKARFTPPSDLPYYATRYVRNRARRHSGGQPVSDGAMVSSWWGPKPDDSDELRRTHPVDELCVIQWRRCVDAALDAFQRIDDSRIHHVVYEELVNDPGKQLARVFNFLDVDTAVRDEWTASVSARSVGKGRRVLGDKAVARLESLARPTLTRLGYA